MIESIVVGIDGSESAEAALEFAAEEASLYEAHLLIVHVRMKSPLSPPPASSYSAQAPHRPRAGRRGFPSKAEELVEAAVDHIAQLQPRVSSDGKVLEGQPASALLREAENADMIVLGSRGRGGFTSLLLGSVSQQVALHAPCPVAIIR